jgi:putative phage-type endonuclease
MSTAASEQPIARRPRLVTSVEREWPPSYLGGPTAAAILGVGFKTALQAWGEMRGLVARPQVNERMEWGLRLEEIVAKKYAETTGREIRRHSRLILHRKYPFIGGHIDRWVFDRNLGKGVLEAKTTGERHGEAWEGEPPAHVQVQVQHYLLVTGCQWGSIAALIGGQKFVTFDIQRNDAFIAALLKKEIEFWQRVQDGTPPPPVGADNALLAAIYSPEDPEGVVDLPAEALQLDEYIRQAKISLAAAMEMKEDAEAKLKAMLGKAVLGRLPGGDGYRWKTEPRKAYTVEPSNPRILRRIKL